MAEGQQDTVNEIVRRYGNDRTRTLDVLREVDRRIGAFSPDIIDALALALDARRVELESTLSFYSFFTQQRRGRFVIRLCNDVVGRLSGLDRVASAFETELGIRFGETTPDGMFTLEWTPFLGMSDQGPAALVNEKVITRLSSDAVREIVRTLRETGDLGRLKRPLGSGNNSHPLVRSMVSRNLRQRGPVLFDSPVVPGSALRKALSMSPAEVIRVIKTSRLRGRGGAGFPTGIKWELVRGAEGHTKHLFCNADEGEPGTFKDRALLTELPDLLFEGMTIGGYAIGADSGIVYLRAEYAYLLAFLEDVLETRRKSGLLGKAVLGKHFDFDIRIQMGAGAYICGEETALLSSCEGTRGDPKSRPPFPAQKGYLGLPTVVNNVETLCCAARIVDRGAGWFNEIGTSGSTGTKLFSVSGDCDRPGVYEVPFGIRLRELLETAGAADAAAVQVGGAAGQMIGPGDFDRTLSYDDLATTGAVIAFGQGRDVLEIVQAFLSFFRDESCGYCTPCRVGNRLLELSLEKVRAGYAMPAELAYLEELGNTIKATSRCGLGQTSPNPILSTLRSFRHEYERRIQPESGVLGSAFDLRKALRPAQEIAGRESSRLRP